MARGFLIAGRLLVNPSSGSQILEISLPPKQGPRAAHALGHFYGLFAKGDCNLLAKLEVTSWHLLGAVGFC